MRPLSFLALVALCAPLLLGTGPPLDSSPETTTVLSLDHSIEITYAERRGDLRQATIRITTREGRARWRGEVEALGFLSSGHSSGVRWQLLSARQGRNGVIEARGLVPAPELLRAFAIRTAEQTFMWESPSARADDDDDKEDPKEPDEGGGDDGDDDGDEDEGCTNTCMDLINPWTCECSDPNPWGDEERERQKVTISF